MAARHLANVGVKVEVVMTRPPSDLQGVPRRQIDTLMAMGMKPIVGPPAGGGDVILDALVGYSLDGPLRGRAADLAGWVGEESAPVLSLDVPSGVDVDTGQTLGAAVAAEATLTLALPKVGIVGSSHAGVLFVGDISVPPAVYRRFGLEVPAELFEAGAVIPI